MTEDLSRRHFIVRLLLLISFGFSAGALLLAWYDTVTMNSTYTGVSWKLLAGVSVTFGGMYYVSKQRSYRLGAYFLLVTYFCLATYTALQWSILLPVSLLLYALVIVMAGIILSTRAMLGLFTLVSGALLTIIEIHHTGLITPDTTWTQKTASLDDAAVYLVILGILTLIAWLFNREMEFSLLRTHYSEMALKQERDMLEIKIEERSRALAQVQVEKMTQLYRLAEIGKLAAGIFHDIATPLTTVSLNLEQLKGPERSDLIRRAIDGTKRVESFIQSARKQIQHDSKPHHFQVKQEIDQTITMLHHRAHKSQVTIKVSLPQKYQLFGSAVKFQQVILNIVLNAIDAFPSEQPTKRIHIHGEEKDESFILTIHDNGPGIADTILPYIFNPFFTTKPPEAGTGLGLSITHDIMTQAIKGSISVTSSSESGTTFTLTFPQT